MYALWSCSGNFDMTVCVLLSLFFIAAGGGHYELWSVLDFS